MGQGVAEMHIVSKTFGEVGGEAFCISSDLELHDDGTWLLRLTMPPDTKPVIDLAGHPTTPVAFLIATIRATFDALGAAAETDSRPEPT